MSKEEAAKSTRCIDCGDIIFMTPEMKDEDEYLCGYCHSRAMVRSMNAKKVIY